MLIGAPIAGLVLGLLAGGRLDNVATVRLRLVQALFFGLFLRYAVELAIENGNDPAATLRLPLFTIAFACLLLGLWANRDHPGIPLAFVGILLNATAMIINGGFMPVWSPAIAAAGLPATELGTAFHVFVNPVAGGGIPADFLLRAIPLGDIIPIPIPGLRNVASLGDCFLAGGLAFFLFATTVRTPSEVDAEAAGRVRQRLASLGGLVPSATDLATEIGLDVVTADGLASLEPLSTDVQLGDATVALSAAAGAGTAGAAAASRARRGGGGFAIPPFPTAPAIPAILTRVRRHPYVRLALDSSFSALWTGQLVSLIGDRVNQVALAFLVLRATNSAIAVGAVFLVSTLPNLLFGPIAGTLVDRWDHREVMIVSDLLRAGVVLLIPIAAVTNLALVYPLVFLVTTVSIFFRPAKLAILPRLVTPDDLIAANSALWIAETFADIGGFALAGLFVALLGSQLPLAFWVDAMTYIASAVLIATIAVAPVVRRLSRSDAEAAEAAAMAEVAGLGEPESVAVPHPEPRPKFLDELKEGWQFLRSEPILLANTLQAAVAQLMLGIFLALTPVYADQSIDRVGFDGATAYSFMEGALGAGNLIGGFAIGLLGARLALGRLVIVGYVATGLAVAALAISGNLYVAVALAFGAGVGNLAFVIPSQTLVQRRTPPELMGRVLGLRFSIVFGSMTIAMGVGGVLGEVFGVAPVIGLFGLITVAAGLAGLLTPAVRDA
jgi:MFS family permease